MLHRVPVPRRPRFDLSRLPRHWYGGSALLTHSVNGLGLVFPEGERFFVRSVRQALDKVDDPDLQARVRGFIAQEALHGRAHEAAWSVLEDDGFEIRSWLRWYDHLAFQVIEARSPAALRLATTAALEHLTAVMGRRALEAGWLDDVPPAMRELLQWHAVEEIEHRAVAFDVFQAVDGRVWVRWAGMGLGLATLLAFWSSAARHLLDQDAEVSPERIRRERVAARAGGHSRAKVVRDALAWLSPSFHPDSDDEAVRLAEAWLAARGEGWGTKAAERAA